MENAEEVKKNNLLVALFKGDIPLVITYWVFGVLISGIGIRALMTLLDANYSSLAITESGLLILQGAYWLLAAGSFFILIAIWRSAGKYEGNAVWSVLARLAVVLNVVIFAGNLWLVLSDTEYALTQEIEAMNNSLPTMVDSGTRLDYVALNGQKMLYNYTLTEWLKADLDLERFKTVMLAKLTTNACVTDETKELLDQQYSLNYIYRDKDHKSVAQIIVTKSDCFDT
ncbi:MAG: hypothetical protein WEA82_09080 [Idiomarina sp.]